MVLASAKSNAVAVPVVQSNLANALASMIGPQVASANRTSSNISLDSYLATLADGDDEEEKGVDAFLGDLLRVRFNS